MKTSRITMSAGIMILAIGALYVSGPVQDHASGSPKVEPGPWNVSRVSNAMQSIEMHIPNFAAKTLGALKEKKPFPELAEDRIGDFMPSRLGDFSQKRSTMRVRNDEDEPQSAFLDSWLLPEEGVDAEPSGWGWLADSVSGSDSDTERSFRDGSRPTGSIRGSDRDGYGRTMRGADTMLPRENEFLTPDPMGDSGMRSLLEDE